MAAAAHPACRQSLTVKITKHQKAEVEPRLLHWMSLQKKSPVLSLHMAAIVKNSEIENKRGRAKTNDFLFHQKMENNNTDYSLISDCPSNNRNITAVFKDLKRC